MSGGIGPEQTGSPLGMSKVKTSPVTIVQKLIFLWTSPFAGDHRVFLRGSVTRICQIALKNRAADFGDWAGQVGGKLDRAKLGGKPHNPRLWG